MDSIENINQSYIDNTREQRQTDNTEMTRDSFMRLFIESLRNQDPLEPMEQSEMMSQITNLALMESVENMKSIVEGLEGAVNGSLNVSSNVELIGKEVKVENSEGEFEGIVVSVGRQGGESVFEMDNGEYYLTDTIVGIKMPTEEGGSSEE